MTDFRISVEELENEAMISEMARAIIQEAMEQEEIAESPLITSIRIECHNSLMPF
jgi:hypothetical protein